MKENKKPKYNVDNLIPMFFEAVKFRNYMVENGFTDNGGAIHSAERIINLLGQRLKYPDLSHGNNYKDYRGAEFSVAALEKYNNRNDEKIYVEHVAPLRDFTKKAISIIDEAQQKGESSEAQKNTLKEFVIKHYRLVMLTSEETKILNQKNRTLMSEDRLNGIDIVSKT
jgi:hypothetical protein